MSVVYEKLTKCLESVRAQVDSEPEVVLVLGPGLGDYAEEIDIRAMLDYHDIEGFSVPMIPGHKGRFVFGYVGEVPVVIMQGRVHFYRGYPIRDVVLPARPMKLMGVKVLLLTNATGGVSGNFHAGDLMLMNDQISTFVPSPLIGENIEEFGPRFPDMSQVYDEDLRELIKMTVGELRIPLQEGIHIQPTGPAYESPAEVRMCRTLEVDAVGMNTACGALAANHMGMKICGISLISNLACGMMDEPLSHKEVQKAVDEAAPLFKKLVTAPIGKIGVGL